jgi:hypothetical protein
MFEGLLLFFFFFLGGGGGGGGGLINERKVIDLDMHMNAGRCENNRGRAQSKESVCEGE